MLVRLTIALQLLLLAAGCGGSGVPEGKPIVVRFELVEPSLPVGVSPNIGPTPQPLTVYQTGGSQWRRVSRLLPGRLPEPVDQGSACVSGHVVSVRLAEVEVSANAASGEVDYGPCRWPKAIEPVRLLMHTLLQRRVAADRRCKCP